MSIRYGQPCPLAKATEVLGERWTILLVRELLLGSSRFGEFQRALSQMSPSLLTKRLGQLVEAELVVRKSPAGAKRPEYHLTAAGRELGPVVMGLAEWGARWARGQMNDDELDVEMLMFDLCRRLDLSKLPGGETVLHFGFRGLEKFPNWWIVTGGGERELCVDPPGKEADLSLATDLRTLTEVWAGDLPIADAKRSGRIGLRGSAALARNLDQWLRPGLFAHVRPGNKAGQAAWR